MKCSIGLQSILTPLYYSGCSNQTLFTVVFDNSYLCSFNGVGGPYAFDATIDTAAKERYEFATGNYFCCNTDYCNTAATPRRWGLLFTVFAVLSVSWNKS